MVEKSMFESQKIGVQKKKKPGGVDLKRKAVIAVAVASDSGDEEDEEAAVDHESENRRAVDGDVDEEEDMDEDGGDADTGDEGGDKGVEEEDVDKDGDEGANEEGEEEAAMDVETAVEDEESEPTKDDDDAGKVRPGYEWRKKVDPDLRRWIVTKSCRRDVSDEYFNSPPRTQSEFSSANCGSITNSSCVVPSGDCCDICNPIPAISVDDCPSTPSRSNSPYSSQHSTPSKSSDENGKRKMVTKQPATRRGQHLKSAREALENWRFRTKLARYSPSSVTAAFLLPEAILKKLASSRLLENTDDIVAKTGWIYAQRHGEEVLELLAKHDQADRNQREASKRAKTAARKAETAHRNEEKKRQEEVERQRKRRVQELEKEFSQAAVTPTPRKPRGSNGNIAGCSVFTLGPSTLAQTISDRLPSPSRMFVSPVAGVLNFQVRVAHQSSCISTNIIYSFQRGSHYHQCHFYH